MTDEERYLFDLQGYLVLRGVLTQGEVDELNEVSDRVYPRDYSDGNDSKGRHGIRNVRYVSRWDSALPAVDRSPENCADSGGVSRSQIPH